METKTIIGVKTSFHAEHRWKQAPEQVKFLRQFHPHTFYVTVEVLADHDNRDVEFFIYKRKLDHILFLHSNTQFDYSCEQLCQLIYEQLSDVRVQSVTVSEDNTNYAKVVFS